MWMTVYYAYINRYTHIKTFKKDCVFLLYLERWVYFVQRAMNINFSVLMLLFFFSRSNWPMLSQKMSAYCYTYIYYKWTLEIQWTMRVFYMRKIAQCTSTYPMEYKARLPQKWIRNRMGNLLEIVARTGIDINACALST